MSSISADGGEAQTRDCPDCGEEMEHDVIKEAGTEEQTTVYQGWYCSSCRRGMVACEECENLHHPDFICGPKREAQFEAATETYGGMADIPGKGVISIEKCETRNDGEPIYVVEDGCPESECEGDLIYGLIQKSNFAEKPRPEAEYQAMYDICSEFETGESGCSHRQP